MQRGKYISVTEIPVLVPCKKAEREGYATFLDDPVPVRRFTAKEMRSMLDDLPSKFREHFLGVVALRKAMEVGDSLALRKAMERVRRGSVASREPEPEPDEEEWREIIKRGPPREEGFTEPRVLLTAAALVPSEKDEPREFLSQEVSNILAGSTLVLWWTGKGFLPAIFTPSTRQALYVRLLLGLVGGRTLAVCPHCGAPFMQERSDQAYCSVQHREAHRVARWRARKRQEAVSKGVGKAKKGQRPRKGKIAKKARRR